MQETVRESQFDFVEYFAGHGNLSRECIKNGWFGTAMDILHSEEHHDFPLQQNGDLCLRTKSKHMYIYGHIIMNQTKINI